MWLSCSLEQKIRYISRSAAAVVILSVAADILVAGLGMREFSSVLRDNSQTLSFWSVMSEESNTFVSLVDSGNKESRMEFETARNGAVSAFRSPLFDYGKIRTERYAGTRSISNLYKSYAETRDEFLKMDEDDQDYLEHLYTIYRVQGYPGTHAARLEQMTVKMGNESYQRQQPLPVMVFMISILWGTAALLMLRRLKQSVSRSIVRPVAELAEDPRRIGGNDFSGPDIQAEGDDKIASLVRAFCTMKASTKGYIAAPVEKHKTEKQLDAVRPQMLEDQINLCFLFNTLNIIASTAQIEDAGAAGKMIVALSHLFCHDLKPTDSVMPLERELKVVQDYMYLQRMQFGQRLSCGYDCRPSILEVLVPSFALQPLVGNTAIHGISPESQGGRIHIRFWTRGRRLQISAAGTDIEIGEERLVEIQEALKQGDEKATGVGFGNIYRRAHVMYQGGEVFLYDRKGYDTVVQMAFTGEAFK